MEGNVLLFALVIFPMVCALVAYLISRKSVKTCQYFSIACAVVEGVIAAALIFSPEEYFFSFDGLCALGINLAFDGFRKVYCGVAAIMWLLTFLFSAEYFKDYKNRGRYYFFNLMTLGAMVGLFLSADLITAFIFFEVMSFASYEWVAHEETPDSLKAADTYLAVAVIGGLTALMGIFIINSKLGTVNISELYSAAAACPDKGALYAAGLCMLFGFGAKAGMFPLHIWLPKAHTVAPAPASALLSGILTKAGIFGILAVSCNIFRYDPRWGTVVLILGTITMVLGALLALFSIDLKRTLACSSISQIGFILVGIGMMSLLGQDNSLAARGTFLHMVNHSMLKLCLFMAAGAVFMNIHELDLNKIRGFGRKKPFLNVVFLIGALGIGGIPLFNGYVSKTLLHESIIQYTEVLLQAGEPIAAMKIVEWLFLISGGLTIIYMTKLYVAIFIEKNPDRQAEYDGMKNWIKPSSALALGAAALGILVLGIAPNYINDGIAGMGMDFFGSSMGAETFSYFSFESMEGTIICVVIAAILYPVVVRGLLMKKIRLG